MRIRRRDEIGLQRQETSHLRAERDVCADDLLRALSEVERLREEVDDTERQRTDEGRGEYVSHGTFSRLVAEKLVLKEDNKKLRAEDARLRAENERLQRSVNGWIETARLAEQNKADREAEAERLRAERDSFQRVGIEAGLEVERLQKQWDESFAGKSAKLSTELEDEVERLRSSCDVQRAWAEDYKSQRDALQTENERLRAIEKAARALLIGSDTPHILSGREPTVDRDELERLRHALTKETL